MPLCTICGGIYEDYRCCCPVCEKAYKKDLAEDHIPPGISKEYYDWPAWRSAMAILRDAENQQWDKDATRKVLEDKMKQYEAKQKALKKNSSTTSEQSIDRIRDRSKGIY